MSFARRVIPFEDETFDLAVSTSCFEHDQCFWITFLEVIRVLKPGGFFYFNAPSNGLYHGYPYDNWRFYPDAGRALVEWAKRSGYSVRLVESGTLRQSGATWNDFVAVFQKAPFSAQGRFILGAFPDAMNVRLGEDGRVHEVMKTPEDMQRIKLLEKQIEGLRWRRIRRVARVLKKAANKVQGHLKP